MEEKLESALDRSSEEMGKTLGPWPAPAYGPALDLLIGRLTARFLDRKTSKTADLLYFAQGRDGPYSAFPSGDTK